MSYLDQVTLYKGGLDGYTIYCMVVWNAIIRSVGGVGDGFGTRY